MNPDQEEVFIRAALDNPNMLCSEAPVEILKESSFAGDEPTRFLMDFFAAGHTQWLAQTYGQPAAAFQKDRVDRAALVLWIRACDLYTSHQYHRPDPNWVQPFFSDEGLY
jgi:hypothetical protein